MSTYLALYVESLEKRIEDGGAQADVDKAFHEYNSFDPAAFEAWTQTLTSVPCASCGALFKPEGKVATAEILCEEHAPK